MGILENIGIELQRRQLDAKWVRVVVGVVAVLFIGAMCLYSIDKHSQIPTDSDSVAVAVLCLMGAAAVVLCVWWLWKYNILSSFVESFVESTIRIDLRGDGMFGRDALLMSGLSQ